MAKPKTVSGYVAIKYSPSTQTVLAALATHSKKFGEHTTLAFRPTEEEYALEFSGIIGQIVTVKVVGMAKDEKGQALAIELPAGIPCRNAHPHVTISCAEGIGAKYSNELLASGQLESVEIYELVGTVELIQL